MPTAYSFRPCRLLVPIRSIERAGWKAFGDKIRCKYELVRRSFAVVSSFNVDLYFSLNVYTHNSFSTVVKKIINY